jgi:hypothetical protein
MPAWLIPAAISAGSALYGALKGGGKDPYGQYLKRAQSLLNPGAVTGDADAFYQAFLRSPAFSQSQSDIFSDQTNLQNRIGSNLANRGLFNTGIGAILPGLANSAGAYSMGRLRSQGYQSALERAMQLRQMLLQGIPQSQPNQFGNAFLGAGLSGIGDILKAYINSKYPSQKVPYGGQG